jgi:hypothetical protein
MTLIHGQKLTISEIEDRAKQMIQAACPDELMEVECLTTDRETGRVFVVLRCLEVERNEHSRHE